jgi:hypothetical protein
VTYTSKQKTVEINLNTNHYLWKKFIFTDNEQARNIKTDLLYPLAISFAICKLEYEKANNPDFSEWVGTATKSKSFFDFFNLILKRLKSN